MPLDDVGEFLKFLDDVSLQLACLLDIDRERDLKKLYNRQKLLSTASRAKIGKSNGGSHRKQQKTNCKQPTRARGRRKMKLKVSDDSGDAHGERNRASTNAHCPQQHHDLSQTIEDSQATKPMGIGADTHPLEVQLSLGLADELSIEHGTPISPATHLSPMVPSPLGHFNHTISQQNYYAPSRGALDSFHLHEEFSNHEPVPITNDQSHRLVTSPEHHHHHHSMIHHQHQHQHQHSQQNQHPHQHLQQHQHQQSGPHLHSQLQHQTQAGSGVGQSQQQHLSNLSDGNFSTLPSMSGCYSQPPIIHHHGPQHQNQHQHQHQHQQHHHQHHHHQQQNHNQNPQQQQQHQSQTNIQYQALDQQWLSSGSNLAGDNSIHILEAHSHNPIEHVVPISPGPNQNLDHIQFGSSLYHQNYYGHQTDHLDPFHQMTGDDFNTSSASLATDNNQVHRLQQDQQQQQSHLNNGNPNGDSYDHNQIQQSQSVNLQLTNPSSTYRNEHQQTAHHSHPQHHHHMTQMTHIAVGIEPSNVIIQDINLASATWTSPEDLYSI